MQYLSKSLSDEPKNLIKHLPATGANYAADWNILTRRYDNKRLLVSKLLKKLFSQPAIKDEFPTTMKSLHDVTKECLHGLRSQGLPIQHWDSIIVHIILQKLDQPTQTAFNQGIDNCRRRITVDEALKFLERRFQSLEVRGNSKTGKRTCGSIINTNNRYSICKREFHLAYECTVFKAAPINKKWKYVKDLKHCVNCLRPGHLASACKSTHRTKCTKRHNTLLHSVTSTQPTQAPSAQNIVTTLSVALSQPILDGESESATSILINNCKKVLNFVLLGTARIIVEIEDGHKVECRAVLDSGSQVNLITERLQRKLRVSSSATPLCIEGVGTKETAIRHQATIMVKSKQSRFSTEINAHIISKIFSDRPALSFHTDDLNIPSNLVLADPDFATPGQIDCLLGPSLFFDLMTKGKWNLGTKLPTLKNTVFGRITSSLKVQYKLLLEQKAIKYVYPGDVSPTTVPARESDWQIVMPYTQAENNEISTVDNNQSVDDNILSKNELSTSTNLSETAVSQRPVPPSFAQAQAAQTGMSSFGQNTNVVVNRSNYQIPPPPPYSVAVNRHLDAEGSTTIATVNQATSSENNFRLQDQQQDIIRGGILPAARARLSSLRSLGSKKLTAIKMRLYDNRQKMEEYIPGSVGSSFAIMDSPSLTPEILGNNSGSFFTLQNLRSTYLISALHSQSNTLTVHTIDANLRPLFYYKIPRNCHDVLISSNILYAIQYVNVKPEETSEKAPTGSPKQESNTEKENRDTDIEKQDCYAKNEILNKNADPEKFVDELAPENRESDSVDTSATTSGRSSSSNGCGTHSSMINAVGVISSAMASCAGHEMRNKPEAVLALFRFENETVLSLYQMATDRQTSAETITKDEKMKVFAYKDIRSPIDYVQFYTTAPDKEEEFSLREMEIMQSEFPKVNYDPCYVITDKNVFYIQMKKEPFSIFLDAALASDWKQCREFCNIFDLSYETCIEFAGDYLLRRNKITQALLTYNSARVKPIRTALKLAIFGHTCALMHLCAMALKITYILKSQYFCSPMFHTILEDITYRHSEDVRLVLPKTGRDRLKEGVVNTGASCSDYIYGVDEVLSNLQMSPSSQFHLANLLLITLAEKAVNNKNYIPLWNFLAVNSKYHTNMTSIVLCQSGLYSSALLLAKVRGVWVDTFVALTSVVAQEFGWYSEFNVCLYNLSEKSFAQTLIYVPHAAVEYFSFIQEKLGQTRLCVLKRLEQQLNPFSAVLRPIVSHNSTVNTNCNSNENNAQNFDFCKALIETYLAVLIHMESQRSKRGQITNALSTFRITYEDNQFAIESSRFKPISAGYAHCACVLDGVAYFWGSNGVPCNYSLNKSSDPPEPSHAVKSLDMLHQLNLEVHTVKCGRQHTLILTNNGLYAFGNNYQSQLGVGKYTQVALQPVLVEALDGKNITTLEAGQYHNAAVADGLLYTWGWGIYGQLGHGDVENVAVPKVLAFFKFKKVLQVSLGHAHSLVLCEGANDSTTDLFVFGSNHFGQLGLGTGDELNYENQLAVDENEKMYTWGSSPQALRLANQIKRRANAKQKLEEQQRREISKQFEATVFHKTPATNEKDVSLVNQSLSMQGTNKTGVLQQTSVSLNVSKQETVENKEKNANSEVEIVKTETFASVNIASTVTVDIDANEETTPKDDNGLKIEIIEDIIEEIVPLVQPMLVEPLRPILQERKKDLKVNVSERNNEVEDTRPSTTEVDPSEHMSPYLVDTSEIAGQILQLSSGLFHFALISSTSTLYTWGKNLEHQLGTEDKERRAVNKPMALDNIESPMYVDCGADFTLVMTTDYAVKAFGGNSNGQCGRDLGPSLEKIKQRVVCLPTTKRLMRFESQCVEVPVEINLPRPSFHSNTIRYLKIIPNFQPHFVQEADINYSEVLNCIEQRSTPSRQHNMNSDNTATGQESDDIISSLENSSNNDIQSNYAGAQLAFGVESLTGSNDISSFEVTPEEQSYARLATATENQNQIQKETPREKGSANASLNQQSLLRTLTSASGVIEETDDSSEEKLQQLRHLTHYCLYIFHGLYNPERVAEFSKDRLEYRIRMHMLNFHFVDAFVLCLEDCDTAHKAVKTFEYYSKDTSFVPVRRQDLRFLIYYLIRHFLVRKLDMLECERFLLTDLDFYLLELAYVLYFNNNNTVLEQNLNQKFKNLIIQDEYQQNAKHKMEDSVIHMIFDSLSIKFKTIVCQQLLRHCSNK